MITKFCSSPSSCNTYVLSSMGEALIIDFGSDGAAAVSFCARHRLEIKAILLTHGHFDHIIGLPSVYGTGIPVYIDAKDEAQLGDGRLNGSIDLLGEPVLIDESKINACFVSEAMTIGHFEVRAIRTPFHTKGSVCYLVEGENALFTGDTLFNLGIGRADLPHALPRKTEESLRKIKALDGGLSFYPGHGSGGKLSSQFLFNPYLKAL